MPDYTPPSSGGGGGAPTGSAGGDLGGTYPNPTVAGVALDAMVANPSIAWGGTSTSNPANALQLYLYPVIPLPGVRRFAVASVECGVQTAQASTTLGVAIYSIVYSAAATFSATKVAGLSAAIDTATAGRRRADFASGPITLDFTANQYVIAYAVSSVATLKFYMCTSGTFLTPGALKSTTTAALTDTTDASFTTPLTQASFGGMVAGAAAQAYLPLNLITTAGKNWS